MNQFQTEFTNENLGSFQCISFSDGIYRLNLFVFLKRTEAHS
jgi:hypothetical protein